MTNASHRLRADQEARIAGRRTMRGDCDVCRQRSVFSVRGGQPPAEPVNLREGLICRRCGLNNRMRLMYHAIRELREAHDGRLGPIYIAEELTPFYEALVQQFTDVTGSEYLPSGGVSGSVVEFNGRQIHQQDLRQLSFDDNSFDLVVHAEILEHVPAHQRALAEIHRVLAPGGEMLFTAPFMPARETNLLRASISIEGEIVHHLAPEMHGDPLDPAGVLVFQTFGWELLDELRGAGFDHAWVGFLDAADLGITSGVLFRARKRGVDDAHAN